MSFFISESSKILLVDVMSFLYISNKWSHNKVLEVHYSKNKQIDINHGIMHTIQFFSYVRSLLCSILCAMFYDLKAFMVTITGNLFILREFLSFNSNWISSEYKMLSNMSFFLLPSKKNSDKFLLYMPLHRIASSFL